MSRARVEESVESLKTSEAKSDERRATSEERFRGALSFHKGEEEESEFFFFFSVSSFRSFGFSFSFHRKKTLQLFLQNQLKNRKKKKHTVSAKKEFVQRERSK